MKLNYDVLGDGPALIILHGLFGSASNFRSLAKLFASHHQVFCLDLRNHGASPHADDIAYADLAADIVEFIDDQGLTKVHILGHSMGGKVAMEVALNRPDKVDKLIVADIAPVHYPPHHGAIFEAFHAVEAAGVKTRGEAEKIMSDYVQEAGVRLFLLTNLQRDQSGGLSWRLNYKVLEAHYDDIAAAPEGFPFEGPALFIRGGLSDYVPDGYVPIIMDMFPNAEIVTIEGTGHWLHAEKPAEFVAAVEKFLAD